MDPWDFTVRVSRSSLRTIQEADLHALSLSLQVNKAQTSGCLTATLSSKKRLEINVTSTLIELALTTMTILSREGDKVLKMKRGQNAPFLVKNRTGYPILLWTATNAQHITAEPKRLESGRDLPWWFEDWQTLREV